MNQFYINAQKIICHRAAANLTQRNLADKAGLSIKTVNSAESGRKPVRPVTVQKLAGALGVEFNDLLNEQTKPQK